MPRKKQTAKATSETTEATADAVPAGDITTIEPQETIGEAADHPPAFTADPAAKISVSLSDYRGGSPHAPATQPGIPPLW